MTRHAYICDAMRTPFGGTGTRSPRHPFTPILRQPCVRTQSIQ